MAEGIVVAEFNLLYRYGIVFIDHWDHPISSSRLKVLTTFSVRFPPPQCPGQRIWATLWLYSANSLS